ncbi:tripartite ATP-independent transporter DctP family solute receptor [Mesorhizobium sp. J18]|uniref:TRAP transporter substrate-binding protein n=1 Tax=Mesorhizobium sp. J18 TaxID=935263 RepID=UPI00119BB666|nr:TRAP transporter substrate-binding protein [Mesorhizobium sp. J18]TWG96395.1 tripartite ATP-independent transporter DctP family solute receptor [Mesorhizobium sp. J18]
MSRKLMGLAVTIGLALGAPGAAMAQDYTWKFGWASADSQTDPNGVTAHEFKKAVEELTGGKIKIELYPNRQLGDEKAMMEGLRFGTIESATITASSMAAVEPAFQVADLPFLFSDVESAYRVFDGSVGNQLAEKMESKGIKVVGYMELGFRQMVNNVRPVTQPSDIVGVKYRVMQSPLYIAMFSSMGGNAIPMAWGEMFAALQQGAIDGMEGPLPILEANKLYEMAKYLSLTNHSYTLGGILVSKQAFDSLPADLQDAVMKAGKQAGKAQREAMGKLNESLVETLKGHGMQVNEITDNKPFREALSKVYADAEATIGKELMAEAIAEADKK